MGVGEIVTGSLRDGTMAWPRVQSEEEDRCEAPRDSELPTGMLAVVEWRWGEGARRRQLEHLTEEWEQKP